MAFGGVGQGVAHAPQFAGSVAVLVQVADTPQHDSGGAQVHGVLHIPAMQLPVAQTLPHAPQLLGSLRMSMHEVVPEASPQHFFPDGQPVVVHPIAVHVPPAQAWPGPHLLPQAPQLSGSLSVEASQPSATTPLQSANPFAQAPIRHVLALQSGVACGRFGHVAPHLPQLLTSSLRLRHNEPQQASPGAHAAPMPQLPAQSPPLHVSPGAQRLGHDPQCAGLVARLTSQPSA
ncbi:MAG: hypothetical protein NVSMB1_04730 [Polyangiales bacterium]